MPHQTRPAITQGSTDVYHCFQNQFSAANLVEIVALLHRFAAIDGRQNLPAKVRDNECAKVSNRHIRDDQIEELITHATQRARAVWHQHCITRRRICVKCYTFFHNVNHNDVGELAQQELVEIPVAATRPTRQQFQGHAKTAKEQ